MTYEECVEASLRTDAVSPPRPPSRAPAPTPYLTKRDRFPVSLAHANTENVPQSKRLKMKVTNKYVAKRLTQVGRDLVHLVVWEGVKITEAHKLLKISPSWCRALAASPPVIGYQNEQLDVRRRGERPRNFHRLTEIRDQSGNQNAAVAAIKVLEQIDERVANAAPGAREVSPGFVIQVNVSTANSGSPAGVSAIAIDNAPVSTVIDAQRVDAIAHDDSDVLWIDGRDETRRS